MAKILKPQKSKRHKKVKDAERYDLNKKEKCTVSVDTGVNRAPKNIKEQEIPRSVRELMKYRENPSLMKKKRKRNRHRLNPSYDGLMKIKDKGMTLPLKPVPDFRKKKHESDRQYLFRVDTETKAVIQRSQFETKYGLDADLVSSKDGAKDKKPANTKKIKNTKRLQEKKEKKREKLKQQREDKQHKTGFEHLQDKVEFGEVAMEPPALKSKPRKVANEGPSRKPGKKSLLLKDVIARNSQPSHTGRQIGQTVKRKDQSFAQQRIMDAERQKAIDLYRQIKSAKEKT